MIAGGDHALDQGQNSGTRRSAGIRWRAGTRRLALWIILGGGLMLGLVIFSLATGTEHLTARDLLRGTWLEDPTQRLILLELRAPRVLAAMLVGMALATSGSLVQSLTRNPLASPDLLGVTGGAAVAWLGVQLLAPFWVSSESPWVEPIAAILGGFGAFALVAGTTRWIGGRVSHLSLIGMAVAVFCGSLLRLFTVLYPTRIHAGLAWLSGSLWGVSSELVLFLAAPILILVAGAWLSAPQLDILALGTTSSRSLGLGVQSVRRRTLLIAVALGSLTVLLSGTIPFVGLYAPHLARLWAGPNHAAQLPASALLGALILLASDLAARTLWQPIELPTGLCVAFLGAPYVIYLLTAAWRSPS